MQLGPEALGRAGKFLAGFLFVSACFHAQTSLAAQTNVTVRVMAANLSSGSNQTYESAGIDIFQGIKPDIVAIQEFNYISKPSSEAQIRSFVNTAFGTNFSFFHETNSGYSIPNGIISRYPMIASGSWVDSDTNLNDRGFAWARIDLPGTNDLYVVSVHLKASSGSDNETRRAAEASELKALISTNFPTNAWIIVAGDMNLYSEAEAAITTFKTFLSDSPVPADLSGGINTNEGRDKRYDRVLPSFSLTNSLVPVVLPSHTLTNGLVFVSTNYVPLSEVAPVQFGDSYVTGMQHMGVVKDFQITYWTTNGTSVPPTITSPPQSLTVTNGNNATFTVVASGDAPLSYQWRFNTTNIVSATNSAYTRSNAQPAHAGDYTVVVTNSAGSVTSSVAVLTVLVPPSITNQPQDLTVTNGNNATFTVGADGTAPLSYQWRLNTTNIAGATNSSYTRTNAQAGDAGDYSVVVTNAAGSLTSSNAVLTVLVPPSINAQPQGQTASQGTDANFSVAAAGTEPLAYQWRFNETNIVGATTNAYTRSNVQLADVGNYSVVITNAAGSVTSSNAPLTLLVPSPHLAMTAPDMLNWQGLSNLSYTVQANSDLTSTNWLNIGTAISPTTDISFTNQSISEPQQFFRVTFP